MPRALLAALSIALCSLLLLTVPPARAAEDPVVRRQGMVVSLPPPAAVAGGPAPGDPAGRRRLRAGRPAGLVAERGRRHLHPLPRAAARVRQGRRRRVVARRRPARAGGPGRDAPTHCRAGPGRLLS